MAAPKKPRGGRKLLLTFELIDKICDATEGKGLTEDGDPIAKKSPRAACKLYGIKSTTHANYMNRGEEIQERILAATVEARHSSIDDDEESEEAEEAAIAALDLNAKELLLLEFVERVEISRAKALNALAVEHEKHFKDHPKSVEYAMSKMDQEEHGQQAVQVVHDITKDAATAMKDARDAVFGKPDADLMKIFNEDDEEQDDE